MTFPRLLGDQMQGSGEVDVGDVQTEDRERSDFARTQVDADELPQDRGLIQGILNMSIRQREPELQQMNWQHDFQVSRRTTAPWPGSIGKWGSITSSSSDRGTALSISPRKRSRRVIRPYFSNPEPAKVSCFGIDCAHPSDIALIFLLVDSEPSFAEAPERELECGQQVMVKGGSTRISTSRCSGRSDPPCGSDRLDLP